MNDTISVSFGTWLKRRRKSLGLTQDSLARQVGCSTVTIKKIESDDLQASAQLAELIAVHVEIAPSERAAFISWARGGNATLALLSDEAPWRAHLPTQSTPHRVSSLPAQLTSVVGREREAEAGCALLRQRTVRVLTLSGPPGIGKTRLGIQIAAELQTDYGDGVCFVPLATVHDPALLTSAIAQTIGVRELPGQSLLTTLQEYLRDKQTLLVLDNFEQVVRAASSITDLLVVAPRVKVLVTSREVLHLYGEQEFPVPPLALPDMHHLPPVQVLATYPAVTLFVARAQAVKPEFVLTDENAGIIAEICAALDGLPLAIEMAAARVKWLTPRALLARLSQRLSLLISGPRDLSARQQTLRGAIDWSYDLLDPAERAMLARFAVFANGATTDAAQVILDTHDSLDDARQVQDLARRSQILSGLRSLADKSLLHIALPEGLEAEPRFTMLGTLREYAHDKLIAADEVKLMRDRHLVYYTRWAEQAEPRLHGPDQIEWLAHFETEHDNLRAALSWALESGPMGLEAGMRLAGALGWFWRVHGHLSEGLKRLQSFLRQSDVSGFSGFPLRAKALSAAGLLAYYQADYTLAQSLYEESVAISRLSSDKTNLAYALHGLGNVCWYQGSQVRSYSLLEESVALYRGLGDRWGIALSLSGLACVLGYQGDYVLSRTLFKESLAISAELGDMWAAAFSLWSLGDVTYAQGDYDGARALYQESLPIARDLGDKPNIAFVLAKLASLAMQQGDYEHLGRLSQEALALFREMGDKWQPPFVLRMQGYVALHNGFFDQATTLGKDSLALNRELADERGMIACMVALGCVAVARGSDNDLRHAAQLFGAVEALLASRDMQLLPPDVRSYTVSLTTLRARLEEIPFTTAYALGQSLTMDQAVALALGSPAYSQL